MEELSEEGPAAANRRFGIRQGAKLRAIDDFSVSGVNGTVSSMETICPADVDQIVANARAHSVAVLSDVPDDKHSFINGLARQRD